MNYFAVLESIIWIAFLYLLYRLYKSWMLELYRDRLFKIREDLFIDIAEKDIKIFDTGIYRYTEFTINTNIRMLEETSISMMLINWLYLRKRYKILSDDVSRLEKELMGDVPKKVRNRLEKARSNTTDYTIQYLFLSSPFVSLLALFIVSIVVLLSSAKDVTKGKNHESRDKINEALGDAYRGSLASKQLATATT